MNELINQANGGAPVKRGDFILIGIVVCFALALAVPKWLGPAPQEPAPSAATYAVISVDGKPYRTVELTEEEQWIEIETERGRNVLFVHDRGIEMFEADCPDEICFTFGWISKPQQTIVCLPNRVLVEIVADQSEGDEIDAVVS